VADVATRTLDEVGIHDGVEVGVIDHVVDVAIRVVVEPAGTDGSEAGEVRTVGWW